jgi:succinate dehydrogenase / fumarate reductase membrane anchor subunit
MMSSQRTRSDPRRGQELGSAKTGVQHWWKQRATAVALIPLTLWFVTALVGLAGRGHAALIAWLESPLVAVFTILLLIALFQHVALGLQVVIEDYVHPARGRLAALLVVQLACLALAVAGVFAVIRIALGH